MVPLTDYMGQGNKIKLNIGGLESYSCRYSDFKYSYWP